MSPPPSRATPLAVPQDLTTLIAPQPGAVVSRVLLKNPSGSVTLFAFDADQELSEHSTPHDALVQIVDGTAEITIAGERHVADRGEALHLPANLPHALKARTAFTMLLVMLRQPYPSGAS